MKKNFFVLQFIIKSHKIMKYSKYSIVIIGTGISGLYAALKSSQGMNLPDGILVMTKATLSDCNSNNAQGGIVAVLRENKKDSVSLHIKDTLIAGCGLSDFNVTKYISENSEAVINDLLETGVDFDRDENKNLRFTLEGAHSVKRILHAGGDATGKFIEQALIKKVKEDSSITLYENTLAVELITDNAGSCRGIVAFNTLTNEYEIIYTEATILASGGVGQLFSYTTNPYVATGDGIALAYRAGAVVQDMEFTQFHPTALAVNNSAENRFLISEALRGEGAKLVDKKGRNFISDYTLLGELAPRDIVTRAIFNEMENQNIENVYLDATKIAKEKLATRFPTISENCQNAGIDISKKSIPVAPAAHYMMGGVKTNVEGLTSVKGLYAIGETACTSLHGANRLASNSLLECVVCAYELSNYLSFANLEISNKIDASMRKIIQQYQTDEHSEEIDTVLLKRKLQNTMWTNVGIKRSKNGLIFAKKEIEKIKKLFPLAKKLNNKQEYELRNMLEVAGLIVEFALSREESRGAHYREDFPNSSDKASHLYMSIEKPITFEKRIEEEIAIV